MDWKRYLPIIGIVLFVYILIKVNLIEIIAEIRNANIYFLVIALIFVVLVQFIQTFKWFAIAVFQDIRVPFSKAVKINLISNFYGFITPSKIGAVIRAEYLKKYTKNIGKGLFNFTADKIMDLSSIIFIVVVFSFVFAGKLDLPVWFFVMLFLMFVFVTLFFISKNRSRPIVKFFYNKFVPMKMKSKIKGSAKNTFDSFYENIPKKRYFVLFFLLNIINWGFMYAVSYFVGLSLGINLPFYFYLAILPLGTLVTLIPISINGLGTREATLITLFGIFGVESAKVFSMSVISLLFAGILPAIVAWAWVWKGE